MAIWTLASKDLRLLLRDRRAALLLLALPLLFILVLGLLLGESFGQKPDDRVRVSLVDLDSGSGLIAGEPWSRVVQRDLAETAGIRLEIIGSRDEAGRLIADHKRSAVLIFEPTFTDKINRCSFLVDGINPFHRDGVNLKMLDVEVLRDDTQLTAAAIIDQVAQGTMLRVVMPWMIGRAFEQIGDPKFLDILAREKTLPGAVKFLLVSAPASQKSPALSRR